MKSIFLVLVAASILHPATAAKMPAPARDDPRIRYVTYDKDDVIVINVQRGTATRIVLGRDEKIAQDGAATGFPSDCSKPELEWCVHADAGGSQVLVKPKDGATHNNLELKTDLRDYSFSFRVLADGRQKIGSKQLAGASGLNVPMYRVIFRYPATTPTLAAAVALTKAAAEANDQSTLAERLDQARPVPKNWKYSMQIAADSGDIAPSLVFDDGRFTYLRFPANREIPTIYAVSPQGEESRVNFHMDSADGSLAVVEKMGRQLVLRLGTATVGIWNEAFDADGIPPNDGTTVAGVARVLLEGKNDARP